MYQSPSKTSILPDWFEILFVFVTSDDILQKMKLSYSHSHLAFSFHYKRANITHIITVILSKINMILITHGLCFCYLRLPLDTEWTWGKFRYHELGKWITSGLCLWGFSQSRKVSWTWQSVLWFGWCGGVWSEVGIHDLGALLQP